MMSVPGFTSVSTGVSFLIVVASLIFQPLGFPLISNEPALPQPRARYNSSAIVDLSEVPRCAVANCVSSQAWIPSKLGCSTRELTFGCFCETAVAPLSCSPRPPSNNDNCFYEFQSWFVGICGADYRTVNLESIPSCGRNCTGTVLSDKGCPDMSLNCVCQLPEISNQTSSCLRKDCGSKGVFSYLEDTPEEYAASWYTRLCTTGDQEAFDEEGYLKWLDRETVDLDFSRDEKGVSKEVLLGLGCGMAAFFALFISILSCIVRRQYKAMIELKKMAKEAKETAEAAHDAATNHKCPYLNVERKSL